MRPAERILDHAVERSELTTASIEAWLGSPDYQVEEEYFREYPVNSLLPKASRCLIHHCIRTLRPKVVVEIGTYKAGTAELIARALWENGDGKLFTTDPFGVHAERLKTIASWPSELQPHVQAVSAHSMEFFFALEGAGGKIDLAFVDGDHDYEVALFDIQMAARNMRRGGTLLVDNAEQSGVAFAAYDFLLKNPDWSVIGFDFRTTLGLPEGPFARCNDRSFAPQLLASTSILRAPDSYSVASPYTFSTRHQALRREGAVLGFVLHPMQQPRGTCERFHWQAHSCAFPEDAVPLETWYSGTSAYGSSPVRILFDEPSHYDAPNRLVEVLLSPQPLPGGGQTRMYFDSIQVLTETGPQDVL
jgi:predicted O-methyltransferase YrrM